MSIESTRRWRQNHPERVRDCARKDKLRKYGLTPETYEKLLKEQTGGCAICERTVPGGRGRFHVDHNHKTGKVRGLLCHSCNLMIGHAREGVDVLQKAISYLFDDPAIR